MPLWMRRSFVTKDYVISCIIKLNLFFYATKQVVNKIDPKWCVLNISFLHWFPNSFFILTIRWIEKICSHSKHWLPIKALDHQKIIIGHYLSNSKNRKEKSGVSRFIFFLLRLFDVLQFQLTSLVISNCPSPANVGNGFPRTPEKNSFFFSLCVLKKKIHTKL